MKPRLPEDKYNRWPDLKRAMISYRQARNVIDKSRADNNGAPTPAALALIRSVRRLVLRLHYKYRAEIRIKREEIRLAKQHAQRYHWQLAQRGRTTTEREALIQSRRQARRQAHDAAIRKREDNRAIARLSHG